MDDNIVKVKFEEGMEVQYDTSLKQWSYGLILQIEGLTLSDGNIEVHFSLTEYNGEAPVSIGTVKDNVITVDIPDFILEKEKVYQPSYEAYAWIYVTDEDSGRTIRKIVFTIEARAKSTTSVPEDQKDKFLQEVRQVMAETKEIAQSVREDADNGEFDGEKGDKGGNGKSAYEYAVEGGFDGTEEEFIESLAKCGDYITKSEHEEQLLKAMIKVTTDKADFHHLTDSANYRVLDFGLKGKTEQETTEGNQLFDISKMELVNATNVGITEIGENYIVITTYDGYTGNGLVSTGKTLQELCLMLEVGETYILTATTESATMARIYVGTAWEFGSTAVMTEDMLNATVILYGHSYTNAIGSCKISNIQIQKGDTATDYEPYTNGPSPNPDYPQKIVNAGVCKNICSPFVYEYGLKLSNGAVENSTSCRTTDFIPYDISATHYLTKGDNASIMFFGYDINKEFVVRTGPIGSQVVTSSTFIVMLQDGKTVDDIKYIRATVPLVDGAYDEKVQIELGTTATEYESHGYKIGCEVVNKNLFDINAYREEVDGVTVVDNTINITKTGKRLYYDLYLPTGTYTLSFVLNDTYVSIVMEDSNGKLLNEAGSSFFTSSKFKIINEIDGYCTLKIYGGGFDVTDTSLHRKISNIQLELGTTATTYTPHQSQQLTLTSPVPITKWDYLTKRDGVWGWSVWSGRTDDFANLVGDDLIIHGREGNKYISNIDLPGASDLNYDKTRAMSESGVHNKLRYQPEVKKDDILVFVGDDDTIETAKEHLHYKVQWKTDEEQSFHPLPDSEQTLLYNLEIYYGVTNMYNDQGCPMWIKYVADNKLYIDNQILEIKQSIV